MSNEARIQALARLGEPVELLWLKGVSRDSGGNWSVQAVVELMETRRRKVVPLPFGLMPILAPGRCFIKGRPSELARRGTVSEAIIPDLRDFDEVTLADVPSSVFPDGQPRRGTQLIYRYRTPALDLFVPPLELIRRLYLHDKTLAHAILRPGGLWDLLRTEKQGFYDRMTLHFKAAMPRRVLTRTFLREIAWIAIHPTGRRSWESVSRLTTPEVGVRFQPPKIEQSKWIFRGLGGREAMLVLEINQLTGKRDAFRHLLFEHPTDRERRPPRGGHSDQTGEGEENGGSKERVEKEFVVKGGGSRPNANPDAFDISRTFCDFIDDSPKITQWAGEGEDSSEEDPGTGDPPKGGAGSSRGKGGFGEKTRQQIIEVGVSDLSTTSELPPLSFKLLEPAPSGYAGTLEALIETLRRMQKLIPAVSICSSLCLLPFGKSISQTGRHRRPCLVATFYRENKPPVVLLDIDHTGDLALAAIGLKFRHAVTLEQMERTISDVLSDLVQYNGHWPSELELRHRSLVEVIRIKRMLRVEEQSDDSAYQTRWAVLLIKKLGVQA